MMILGMMGDTPDPRQRERDEWAARMDRELNHDPRVMVQVPQGARLANLIFATSDRDFLKDEFKDRRWVSIGDPKPRPAHYSRPDPSVRDTRSR